MKKPEVKAMELVEGFIPIIDPNFGKLLRKTTLSRAKACAIRCVDEIIEENGLFSYKISPLIVARRKFWLSVKEEIESL